MFLKPGPLTLQTLIHLPALTYVLSKNLLVRVFRELIVLQDLFFVLTRKIFDIASGRIKSKSRNNKNKISKAFHSHMDDLSHSFHNLPAPAIRTFASQQEKQCSRDLDLML